MSDNTCSIKTTAAVCSAAIRADKMNTNVIYQDMKKTTGPGPADYCIKTTIGEGATDPTIKRSPTYIMQGKYRQKVSIWRRGW